MVGIGILQDAMGAVIDGLQDPLEAVIDLIEGRRNILPDLRLLRRIRRSMLDPDSDWVAVPYQAGERGHGIHDYRYQSKSLGLCFEVGNQILFFSQPSAHHISGRRTRALIRTVQSLLVTNDPARTSWMLAQRFAGRYNDRITHAGVDPFTLRRAIKARCTGDVVVVAKGPLTFDLFFAEGKDAVMYKLAHG